MRTVMLMLALCCLLPSPAVAQVTPEVSVGQRIWVRWRALDGRWERGVRGTLEAVRDAPDPAR